MAVTETLALFLVAGSWNRAAAFTSSGICPPFFEIDKSTIAFQRTKPTLAAQSSRAAASSLL